MANNSHVLSPDCDCAGCRLVFPQEPCHYCGARAHNDMSLTDDGVTYVARYFCVSCTDALRAEHNAMYARIPEATRLAWEARNTAILATIQADPDNQLAATDDEGDLTSED